MVLVASARVAPLVPAATSSRSNWRRFRIGLLYWWRHGAWPDLDRPLRFTEWVQWRKLNDSSTTLAMLSDKLHAKHVASERCGEHLPVPTLWSGTVLPAVPPAPLPLVVKSNHGCGQVAIVFDRPGWERARRLARGWLGRPYGEILDERSYRSARAMILVEPFLGDSDGSVPDDYKVYVFGGTAAIVQHHVGRFIAHRWTQFDRDWRRVGGATSEASPPPNLASMIEAAERLGAGHDFVRVDFFDVGGRLWFGEFALCPGSGLDPFDPPELDDALGRLWSEARGS